MSSPRPSPSTRTSSSASTHTTTFTNNDRTFSLSPTTLTTLDHAFANLPIASRPDSLATLTTLTAHLGGHSLFARPIDAAETVVWLLDNTAYRVEGCAEQPWRVQPWETVVTAACFLRESGRSGVGEEEARRSAVRRVVRLIAEVAEMPRTQEVERMIEKRLGPWLMRRVVGRTLDVRFAEHVRRGHHPSHAILQGEAMMLVPTEADGVSRAVLRLPEDEYKDGEALEVFAAASAEGSLSATTQTCSGRGWAVVSTVEVTLWQMESIEPKTIFRKAFVDQPTTIDYMPELLEHMRVELETSHFWYLANAPVSLYPILRELREQSYPPGTILLRDGSWTTASGLLASFLRGVKEHKLEQLQKLYSTFPRRSVILLGSCSLVCPSLTCSRKVPANSAQVDPEVFAEIYRQYPGWVRAIYVRFDGPESLLVPSPHQGATKKMVENIFKGIPKTVWCIFSKPHEIHERISSLGKSSIET